MDQSPRQPVFCTSCGQRLEDFCFSTEAKDLEALRAQAFKCLLEGRRITGMCAALFIADDAHPAQPGEGPAAGHPPVDEEALRRGILERITREGESPAGDASGGDTTQGPSLRGDAPGGDTPEGNPPSEKGPAA